MSTYNCSNIPTETATDAGVAGAGVLLSFIITASISFIFSLIIILFPISSSTSNATTLFLKILRKLLLSLSDQQLITGIGIQSLALFSLSSMVPYHFFLIFLLSILSTAVHISTLFALIEDFKRDWVLRWLRQFFMFVNLLLSCTMGSLVIYTILKGMEATLPVGCVWEVDTRASAAKSWVGVFGTVAVMTGQVIFFVLAVWSLHLNQGRWIKVVKIGGVGALVVLGALAMTKIVLLSQAFGRPSVKLMDEGEKEWNFGQLLALLLLVLPLISAVEILRGEMNIPSPTSDDTTTLLGEKNEITITRASEVPFQPNPFWGNQESRFSKWSM